MPLSDKTKKKISSSRFLSSLAEDEELNPGMKKLHSLFAQIELEFDKLYQENLNLQERLDAVLSKENYAERGENLESDKVLSAKKSLTGSVKAGSYKIRAQTSKIVSSFKTSQIVSSLIRDFSGHKDGVWQVSSKLNQPIIGTASADHTACIWSVESGRCLLQYCGHHNGSVNSIKFHNSKDLVLTASGDASKSRFYFLVVKYFIKYLIFQLLTFGKEL
jgi:WD40 repeat protein